MQQSIHCMGMQQPSQEHAVLHAAASLGAWSLHAAAPWEVMQLLVSAALTQGQIRLKCAAGAKTTSFIIILSSSFH